MHHSEQLPNFLHEEAKRLKLGATGEYPNGRLHEQDEGEIIFAVAADEDNQLVHLNFGKPISFVSMDPKQAIEVAQSLIKHASGISREKLTI